MIGEGTTPLRFQSALLNSSLVISSGELRRTIDKYVVIIKRKCRSRGHNAVLLPNGDLILAEWPSVGQITLSRKVESQLIWTS